MLLRADLLIDHRNRRRHDFEEYKVLERNGKRPNDRLARISKEFEAIDSLLREELPTLHQLVTKLATLMVEKLALAQVKSFSNWRCILQRSTGLADTPDWDDILPDWAEIEATFRRDFESTHVEEQVRELGIITSSQSWSRFLPTEGLPMEQEPEVSSENRSRQPATVSTDHPQCDILWSAVSLFEFNLETTRQEAGYNYLHYAVGEVCPNNMIRPLNILS